MGGRAAARGLLRWHQLLHGARAQVVPSALLPQASLVQQPHADSGDACIVKELSGRSPSSERWCSWQACQQRAPGDSDTGNEITFNPRMLLASRWRQQRPLSPSSPAGALRFISSSSQEQQEQQQEQHQQQEQQQASPAAASSTATGKNEVWNTPNLLSLSRALSGPVLSYQISQDMWVPAVGLLLVAGVTDWLDGYVARKQGLTSALGSYLDPLADKILIGCVVGALAAKALIPTWVAAVVIGRDVALVSGGFLMRGRQVGWRWPGAAEFFKVEGSGAQGLPGIPAARRMNPSWISKVNTVLQLGFVGCCITQAWYGWPAAGLVEEMEMLVVATTLVSGLGYVKNVMKAD